VDPGCAAPSSCPRRGAGVARLERAAREARVSEVKLAPASGRAGGAELGLAAGDAGVGGSQR
jgi:hypothetical protein